MSSDNFDIELIRVSGAEIDLHVTTGGAGGVQDMAVTRSFVLMALDDALRAAGSPKARAAHPLRKALDALDWENRVTDEAFYVEHVAAFVESVELGYRLGFEADAAWLAGRAALGARYELDAGDDSPIDRLLPRHAFGLRARVTDTRFLKGLRRGTRFGTTAYDAWLDDPMAEEALRACRATTWPLAVAMRLGIARAD